MYAFKISNRHIIINIDNKKFLLDTGSPNSFWTSEFLEDITIDGVKYQLSPKPYEVDLDETFKTIGTNVDGFIGLDIVRKTSLTIYKNGTLEFKAKEEDGMRVPMNIYPYLSINVGCSDYKGLMIIDTGAMYAYGVNKLFGWRSPYLSVTDYNPHLKKFRSDLFDLDIYVNGKRFRTDIGRNEKVSNLLTQMNAVLIGGLNNLFNEVCVIDIQRKELIIR